MCTEATSLEKAFERFKVLEDRRRDDGSTVGDCEADFFEDRATVSMAMTSKPILTRAIIRLNKPVQLLLSVISVFNQTHDSLPSLPRLESVHDLDQGIQEMQSVIRELIQKHPQEKLAVPPDTSLRKVGQAFKTIITYVTPFLKNMLSVTINGSAVLFVLHFH